MTENYVWALQSLRSVLDGCLMPRVILTDRDMALMNALDSVFPDSNALLCPFHISCNVYKNRRPKIHKDGWDKFSEMWCNVVDSETFDDYVANVELMAAIFGMYPDALKYIGELLLKYRNKFVACWTNGTLHIRNRMTNHVEGQHSKLKKYHKNSKGSLETVWSKVDKILNSQASSIKNELERSKSYFPHAFKISQFALIRSFVSASALQKILDEMKSCTKRLNNDEGVDLAIDEFRIIYSQKNPSEQLHMKKQHLEISLSSRTTMNEPEVIKSRGRPGKTLDGNCGFRVVAKAIGKELGPDDWMEVRTDLHRELDDYAAIYFDLFGPLKGFAFIRESLTWNNYCAMPPWEQWMHTPEVGYLIASAYNVTFVTLDVRMQGTLTFLPMHSAPPENPIAIVLTIVNKNHFVEVITKPDMPMSQISPRWSKMHYKIADTWGEIYRKNINFCKGLIKQNHKDIHIGVFDDE